MTDEEIDTSDIPPLTDEFFRRAQWRMPSKIVDVTLPIDPVLFAWFKAQGSDWPQRMNAALRIYAAAHLTANQTKDSAA